MISCKELYLKSRDEYNLDDRAIDYMFKYYLNISEFDMKSGKNISNERANKYLNKLNQLKKGIPIQYVVGNVDFYGYNFLVKKGVLIPRFETEQLVYYTKEYILKLFDKKVSILDIGTGSGVIGISLKKELPNSHVTMIDISTKALNLSASNAKRLGVDAKIYKSNMLDGVIKQKEKYDIIISNPPYLMKNEEIMDIVYNNEPHKALFGGNDGLKFYREIISHAKEVINNKALLAFEIGANQASDIAEMVKKYLPTSSYEVKKGLDGRDRMFFIFLNLDV